MGLGPSHNSYLRVRLEGVTHVLAGKTRSESTPVGGPSLCVVSIQALFGGSGSCLVGFKQKNTNWNEIKRLADVYSWPVSHGTEDSAGHGQ